MPVDFVAVQRHLASDDAVSVLLRGHLWVETALTDLIRASLEAPDRWRRELERLPFPSKVALAEAQGELPWPRALLELNRIRNKVGHDPRFEIDDSVAHRLTAAFEPDFGQLDEPGELGVAPSLEGGETPAEVVRLSVLALLSHIFVLTSEVFTAKTNVMTGQIRRIHREFPELHD